MTASSPPTLPTFSAASPAMPRNIDLVLAADVFVYVNDLCADLGGGRARACARRSFRLHRRDPFRRRREAFADAALCPRRAVHPSRAQPMPASPSRFFPRFQYAAKKGCRWIALSWSRRPRPRRKRPLLLPDDRSRAARSPAGHFRTLVRQPRLGAARASARTSGQGASRPFGAADRADRRRQDAGRISAEPGGVERLRWLSGCAAERKENSSPPAATCAARAACTRSTSRRSRRSPSTSRATWKRRSPRWACRSASRRAPATRRPRSASASAAIRRRSC